MYLQLTWKILPSHKLLLILIFGPAINIKPQGIHNPEIVLLDASNKIIENIVHLAMRVAGHDGLIAVRNGDDGDCMVFVIQQP